MKSFGGGALMQGSSKKPIKFLQFLDHLGTAVPFSIGFTQYPRWSAEIYEQSSVPCSQQHNLVAQHLGGNQTCMNFLDRDGVLILGCSAHNQCNELSLCVLTHNSLQVQKSHSDVKQSKEDDASRAVGWAT